MNDLTVHQVNYIYSIWYYDRLYICRITLFNITIKPVLCDLPRKHWNRVT